ncbi:MAG: hypothetical protein JW728_02145 [Candidatus Aureabacteria bacterium]|nr:hypothetical protein [Candidatus Auribacterota bacterium]
MPRNRNRRLRLNTTQNSMMLRMISYVSILVAYGFFFVWQNIQCVQTGENIRELEDRMKKIIKENNRLEFEITQLKAPYNIHKSIKEYNLQMVAVRENQIVKLR